MLQSFFSTRIKRMSLRIFGVASVLLFCNYPHSFLLAKGLDSFSSSSTTPVPKSNVVSQPTTPSATPSTTGSSGTVQPSTPSSTNPGNIAATPPGSTLEPKTFVKSEISKRLENRLSLGMNFGWIGLSAAEGEWSARAVAGVEAGYQITQVGGFPLIGVLGYSASDATLVQDKDGSKHSFRALVQSYSFGVLTKQNFRENWNWRASLDLDLHLVSLDSLDGLVQDDIDDDLKASGVSLRFYGGADWKWQENFLIGPGLGLGFGRFSTVQFLAKSTFIF